MQPGQSTPAPQAVHVGVESWWTTRRFGWVLALLLCAAVPQAVLGSHAFFFRDFGTLAYPAAHYQREQFWGGRLPLWNPLSNCGTPFLAQWNTLTLYPLSLLYLLLPLPWSLNWFCLLHWWLGGMGMFWLVRGWVGCRLAAAFAGVAFVFGGVSLSSHVYPNYLVTLGWMPWVVGLVNRAWCKGGRLIPLAAGVGGLQMLSGAPELILQTWGLLLALWFGGTAVQLWQHRGGRRCPSPAGAGEGSPAAGARPGGGSSSTGWRSPWPAMLWRFPLVVLLVAGLTAVQMLPFLDLLAHSQRGSGYATGFWSMPGWGWANLLLPLFHCFSTPQGVYFQAGQAFLISYYPGVGVVVLGLLGVLGRGEQRVRLLGGLGCLSLVLALGPSGWLYPRLREIVPLLEVVRYPIKFVYLGAFVAPVLAAYGIVAADRPRGEGRAFSQAWAVGSLATVLLALMASLLWFVYRYPYPGDQWTATWHNALVRALVLVATVAAVVWRGAGREAVGALTDPAASVARRGPPWGRRLAGLALLFLLWADLQTQTPWLTPLVPNAAYTAEVTELRPKPEPGGVRAMITPRAERLLQTRTLRGFLPDFLGSRLALWSNLNLLDDIPKVNGAATLQLRAEAEVEAWLYATATNRYRPLERFLGVAYTSSPGNPVEWVAQTNCLPLATIGQAPVFASGAETLRRLLSPEFTPAQVVYLPLEAKGVVAAGRDASARILTQRFSPQRIDLVVRTSTPTLLSVAQSYYHPWRAWVDDAPTTVWQANYAFQAVALPGGTHRIRLVYHDRRFELGAWISVVTALGMIAAFWRVARLEPPPRLPSSLVPLDACDV